MPLTRGGLADKYWPLPA